MLHSLVRKAISYGTKPVWTSIMRRLARKKTNLNPHIAMTILSTLLESERIET